jgi:peptidoglycan/xylan/chitin deacetylase (PgdA/CDA1 family)
MTKNLVGLCFGVLSFALTACGSSPDVKKAAGADTTAKAAADATQGSPGAAVDTSGQSKFVPGGKIPPPSVILGKTEVPILCYHQIRDWKPTDSKTAKDYIMPIADFRAEMKMLHDSGYHSILPDQLYAYLTTGAALPSKPIMLTFDDNDEDQYTIAFPELKKYNFKGVFFIMTITLGKLPHYMSKEQVKEMYDAGNVIASHTWDHHNVKKYQGKDWEIQIDKPTKVLEGITGKPIRYFAYPFGLWNRQAFPELRKRGFIAAFALADHRDDTDPLMCIRRIIVAGGWSLKTFNTAIHRDFR